MPKRKYRSNAERQRAYRERHADAKALGLGSEKQRLNLRSELGNLRWEIKRRRQSRATRPDTIVAKITELLDYIEAELDKIITELDK